MSRLERALWALTVAGFVVPYALIGTYVGREGVRPGAYVSAWFATLPMTQLTLDLFVASGPFAIWAIADNRRRGAKAPWLPIPASLFVGLCFSLPLHFALRERRARGSTNSSVTTGGPASSR